MVSSQQCEYTSVFCFSCMFCNVSILVFTAALNFIHRHKPATIQYSSNWQARKSQKRYPTLPLVISLQETHCLLFFAQPFAHVSEPSLLIPPLQLSPGKHLSACCRLPFPPRRWPDNRQPQNLHQPFLSLLLHNLKKLMSHCRSGEKYLLIYI